MAPNGAIENSGDGVARHRVHGAEIKIQDLLIVDGVIGEVVVGDEQGVVGKQSWNSLADGEQ